MSPLRSLCSDSSTALSLSLSLARSRVKLYAVAHSAGVHAMPGVNTLLAHLLAAQVVELLKP